MLLFNMTYKAEKSTFFKIQPNFSEFPFQEEFHPIALFDPDQVSNIEGEL